MIAQPWPAWMHAANAVVPDRGGDVGVVEHDRGGLAAELEEDLLQRRRGRGHDRPAGRGGAGERDQVDARVGGRARAATVVVARGDDVEHARREVGVLGGQPAELAGRPTGCPAPA